MEDPDSAFDFKTARALLMDYFRAAEGDAPPLVAQSMAILLLDHGKPESQVRAWQEVRAAGLLPVSAADYLIALNVESIGELRAARHPRIVALRKRLDEIEREAGFDPSDVSDAVWAWVDDDAPPEYRACWAEIMRIEERLTAGAFLEVGETRLAEMFEARPDEFDRHYAVGRNFFLPATPWAEG